MTSKGPSITYFDSIKCKAKVICGQLVSDLMTVGTISSTNITVTGTVQGSVVVGTATVSAPIGDYSNFVQAPTGTFPTVNTVSVNGSSLNTDLSLKGNGTGLVTVVNQADTTKKLSFTTAGNNTNIRGTLATAFTTAKTVTLPDTTTTLAGLATTQTFTAVNTFSSGINLGSSTLTTYVQNDTSFTSQFAGPFATTAAQQFRFEKIGNVVVLSLPAVSAASNAVNTTIINVTAIPAAYRPASQKTIAATAGTANGVANVLYVTVNTSGFMTIALGSATGTFGVVGTVGWTNPFSITYSIS